MGWRGRTRRGLCGAAVVVTALLMTACGASGGVETIPSERGSSSFPVELTHAQGTVVISERPQRVVVLGSADAQIASALGVPIVGAVRDPSSADGNWPGMAEPLPAELLVLDSTGPNLEQIAALHPDLILATSAQPAYTQLYDQLSRVAPVVSYRTALLQDSGEDLVRLIARATGTEGDADTLIASSDRTIDHFATEFAGLKGKTFVFGQYAGGTTYLVANPAAQSAAFLERLGMTIPAEIRQQWSAGDTSYAGSVGMITPGVEQLDVLDSADVALISGFGENATEEFTAIPLVSSSKLLREGRLHMIGQDLAAPLLQPNPATTAYLLDRLRPYLAQLVGSAG